MANKRSVSVLIFNSKHELALQLRAAHDDSFPSHWNLSAAGGVEEGEEPMQAAIRELKEELGIDAGVTFIAECALRYLDWGTSEPKEDHAYIYKTLYEGEFVPDPSEVQTVNFFTLNDIEEMMKSGQKFHPEFRLIWDEGLVSKAAVI